MGERERPWQLETREKPVRSMQIKYMWETSIPASWKKIKGERHFQRHMTKLRVASSYDALPTIEKTLLTPILPNPQSPIRMRKRQPLNLEGRGKGKIVEEEEDSFSDTERPYLGSLVLVSRENSPCEDIPPVHFSESPSKRDSFKPPNITLVSPQKLPPVFRSGHVPAKELDQQLTTLSKTTLHASPNSSLMRRYAKKYSKVVISNPEVQDFLGRFERKKGAKVARLGRKGFMGQKLPWSKQKDLNWEDQGETRGEEGKKDPTRSRNSTVIVDFCEQ
jgi:hypothetical protein